MMVVLDEIPGGLDWYWLYYSGRYTNTPILLIGGQHELDSP